MAKYFNYFPQTYYFASSNNDNVVVGTNLLSHFTLSDDFVNNTSIYYKYAVIDGESPEVLSHKIYGSAEKHWIILLMNNIFNPLIDWPVDERSLINIIDMKYTASANVAGGETGLEWAQQNVQSYYKIITQTNNITSDVTVDKIQIDSNTYVALTNTNESYTLQDGSTVTIKTTKDSKTYYDYEMDINDDKRIIKILKPEYVTAITEEFRKVFE